MVFYLFKILFDIFGTFLTNEQKALRQSLQKIDYLQIRDVVMHKRFREIKTDRYIEAVKAESSFRLAYTDSTKSIVFLHIGKSGGTSFDLMMKQINDK